MCNNLIIIIMKYCFNENKKHTFKLSICLKYLKHQVQKEQLIVINKNKKLKPTVRNMKYLKIFSHKGITCTVTKNNPFSIFY